MKQIKLSMRYLLALPIIAIFRVFCLASFLYLAMTSSTMAGYFVVNSTLDLPDSNAGDLICKAKNGKCTLRAAVMQANVVLGFHTIEFQSLTMSFKLGTPLDIYREITIDGFGSEYTVIDGGNLSKAFVVHGSSLTLDGVTIQNARPAIEVKFDGAVSIKDSLLINNTSDSNGGAINVSSGEISLVDSVLVDNRSSGLGGAVYVRSPVSDTGLRISGSTFESNIGEKGGGAIYMELGDVAIIEDSVFKENSTSLGNGGALAFANNLFHPGGSVLGCDIRGNSALDGGGIWIANREVNLEIIETNVYFNDASNGAGIFLDATGQSTVTIRDTSIFDNESIEDGGGLKSVGSEIVEIVNSTLSGNKAQGDGGGLFLSNNRTGALIYSSTITLNVADSESAINQGNGGGIYVESGGGLVYIRNSILADNDDLSTGVFSFYTPDCFGSLASDGYNLIGYANFLCDLGDGAKGDLVGDATNGTIAPLLVNTLEMKPEWPTFVHRLTFDSPARNAGDPAGCFDLHGGILLKTDQVGRLRPLGPRCDMGAFEENYVVLDQTITGFVANPVSGIVGGSAILSVTGSGASGNPVTYGSTTTGICAVSGSEVNFIAAGDCRVTADQAGDDDYLAAPRVFLDIIVSSANKSISLKMSALPTTYILLGEQIQYTYIITNEGNVTLNPGVASVQDDQLSVTCPVQASIPPQASVICGAIHSISQSDLDAGLISNKATANVDGVTSSEQSLTVRKVTEACYSAAKSIPAGQIFRGNGTTKISSSVSIDTKRGVKVVPPHKLILNAPTVEFDLMFGVEQDNTLGSAGLRVISGQVNCP